MSKIFYKNTGGTLRPIHRVRYFNGSSWDEVQSMFRKATGGGLETVQCTYVVEVTTADNYMDLFLTCGSPSDPCTVLLYVRNGAVLYSNNVALPALDTGTGWASGTRLHLYVENGGVICGKGGNGGKGGDTPNCSTIEVGDNGGDGGDAILLQHDLHIWCDGIIAGGGGGGGGAGASLNAAGNAGAGGGGGGAGMSYSSGAIGGGGSSVGCGAVSYPGDAGTVATYDTSGGDGGDGANNTPWSGRGGDGGTDGVNPTDGEDYSTTLEGGGGGGGGWWGQSGADGGNGVNANTSTIISGGTGGAPGKAIELSGNNVYYENTAGTPNRRIIGDVS